MVRNTPQEGSDGFSSLGLESTLIQTLTKLGYEEPTPIQRESIPRLLEGRDLVGQAATGTGKTAAFALPILQLIAALGKKRLQPSALILVPTRELAMQISEAVYKYSRALKVSVLPIYGGQSFTPQLRGLERGTDVIVATPGRALDHIRRKTLKLENVSFVVLDEADEMLDMGFAEDLEAILEQTPDDRQTILFSATIPKRVAGIAKRHLDNPVEIKIAREPMEKGAMPRIRQTAYLVHRAYKTAALGSVLDLESPSSALVFCRTRTEVDQLAESLSAQGYRAEALHGGMTQMHRDKVMKRLRSGSVDLVIATDVAARGLDIEKLSHVVNYDVPSSPDSYVHRIGRVGRAGREGVALTLVEPRERRILRNFEQATKQKIEMAQVPTVADLKARRLELTRTNLREALLEKDFGSFSVVVESLAAEFDLLDIAAAAVKLAHEATGMELEGASDIPSPLLEAERQPRKKKGPERAQQKTTRVTKSAKKGGRRSNGQVRAKMARLHVNLGRIAGIRPQDLVGAITGEAGMKGRDVGGIDIGERFSLVDVPEDSAQRVMGALRGSKIKGRKVRIRLEASA